MQAVLDSYDQWLTGFGKRFVHLDSGGDEYVGFIVDAQRVEAIVELAQQAGVKVSLEGF
jgi:hypothetical protein